MPGNNEGSTADFVKDIIIRYISHVTITGGDLGNRSVETYVKDCIEHDANAPSSQK